ncbi:MAG: zinc ribbon domain-containing protein [Clostridiales bacterium]|jgi:hypothetical protein|nr:zinc ribbon domain-containing protein [Clostridiales bacterium]
MAIIVRHRDSKKVYALIGTGFGAFKSTRPSLLGGSLLPHEESGEIPVAAVSDRTGVIKWFYTDELEILEVDGVKIEDLLRTFGENEEDNLGSEQCICPACQSKIPSKCNVCPSCGLFFPE